MTHDTSCNDTPEEARRTGDAGVEIAGLEQGPDEAGQDAEAERRSGSPQPTTLNPRP